jgi:hypothetical protein
VESQDPGVLQDAGGLEESLLFGPNRAPSLRLGDRTYSSISFGLLPAAVIRVGFSISVGIVVSFTTFRMSLHGWNLGDATAKTFSGKGASRSDRNPLQRVRQVPAGNSSGELPDVAGDALVAVRE